MLVKPKIKAKVLANNKIGDLNRRLISALNLKTETIFVIKKIFVNKDSEENILASYDYSLLSKIIDDFNFRVTSSNHKNEVIFTLEQIELVLPLAPWEVS